MSESRWMAELKRLGRGGSLDAPKVVEVARDKRNPLHDCFTWDNTKAGEQWRLHEARNLIRVYSMREMEKAEPDAGNVFVSLRSDRGRGGNGYRSLANVLSDGDLRDQLLADAFEDMKYFRLKYKRLSELQQVFSAMDSVAKPRRAKLKAAA